jgi:hypothetical protein
MVKYKARIPINSSIIFGKDMIENYVFPQVYIDTDPLKLNEQGVSTLGTAALPRINSTTLYPYVPDFVRYNNLNYDKDLRRKMTLYFFDKMEKWLATDMKDLINFVVIQNNKGRFIKNSAEFEKERGKKDNIDKKINFLMNTIINKMFMYNTLKRYTNKTKTNWYDLKKNKIFVKEYIRKRIRHDIKKSLKLL